MGKKKGRCVKAVINLGYVFRKKKVSLVFQWEGLCSGQFNMKIPERRGARMLNAQQYHCPRFAAINRQEPTTMPLQICLRLYSKYPQWRHVSILGWGNNKKTEFCTPRAGFVPWWCNWLNDLYVIMDDFYLNDATVNVNKLIKPCFCFLKRYFSLVTMLCRP